MGVPIPARPNCGVAMEKQWVLYILECGDGTLYTGITDNFERRMKAHKEGKGAKYTRGRGPLTVRYLENCVNHSAALKREYQIKQLTKKEKIKLCTAYSRDA